MHDAKKTKAQLFQELAALRQQLAELFENASDAAYTLDLAGNITGVKRAVELLTGAAPDFSTCTLPMCSHQNFWSAVIRITLTMAPEALTLSIQDDGHGLPDTAEYERGIGLRLMAYRADLIGANLVIQPTTSNGTLVTCTVPTLSTAFYVEPEPGTKS
jgi:hypothetical protein